MTSRSPKLHAHVRLARQLADLIDQKRRAGSKRERYWNETRPDEILDTQPRTQIVVQIIQHTKAFGLENITDIKDAFFSLLAKKEIIPVITRGGGKDRYKKDVVPWTKDTAYDWLIDANAWPQTQVAEQLAKTLGELLDKLIVKAGIQWQFSKRASSILVEKSISIHGALEKILEGLPPPETTFRPHKGYLSAIDPVLAAEGVSETLPEQLGKIYKRLIESVRSGEARTTVLTGPYFSGKKSVIRQLIAEGLNKKQQLQIGRHRLPTLAISLADVMPWQFLERVFEFYQQANEGFERPTTSSGIVESIRWMSDRTPAFVILTDVDPIDENAIVRALGQDQVGEVLLAILDGDERSRVVLTATSDNPFGLPRRRIAGRAERVKVIELKESARDSQARHLTRVSKLLLERADLDEGIKETLGDLIEGNFKRGRPDPIFDLIFHKILDDETRLLAGVIASSVDGLENVTLEAIADEMKQSCDAPEVQSLDVYKTLRKLEGLVLQRSISSDPRRGSKRMSMVLFRIQKDCNRDMLARWVMHRPALARMAFWMIAREAAAQSRAMRTRAIDLETIDSLGRDIQALTTLLASIDPKEATYDGAADVSHSKASEWTILPPLGVKATKPAAELAYRYAYEVLYKDDLEGSGQRLLARHDDARMRLGAIMPFFSPDKPWETIDDWKLGPVEHFVVRRGLTPEETVEMLESTAIAAVRARKYDLVQGAARLARELFLNSPKIENIVSVQRILRAEADANILVGGDTKRSKDRGGMHAVLVSLDETLENFASVEGEAPERTVARGKLLARRAEVLHLAGNVDKAEECFRNVETLELKIREFPKYRFKSSPILAGRGVRSYLRLAIDLAKREGWKKERTFAQYPDIAIPFAKPVVFTDQWLLKARELEALNARRLSRGRSADWIGARIDASRLAMAQHEYAAALQHLDDALKFRFTPGSSIETLLELLAVRARTLVDGAAMAMAWYDMGNREYLSSYQLEIEKLCNYVDEPIELRKDDDQSPENQTNRRYDTRALSRALNVRAREALNALKRFLEPSESPDYPYLTFANYLEVWLEIIETRQTNLKRTASHLSESLRLSRQKLQNVISVMKSTGYCMHLHEAELLLKGLGG